MGSKVWPMEMANYLVLPLAGSPEGRASASMAPQHYDRTTGQPEVEPRVKGTLVGGPLF